MIEIKCPYDLNQFILGEPIFENPFPEEECEKRKFYGDCYHCFSTAIASRDHQLKASVTPQQKKSDESDVLDKIRAEIKQEYKVESAHPYGQGLRRALEIIDKYKAEGSDKG